MNKTHLAIILIIVIFIVWLQPFNFGKIEITIPDDVNAYEIGKFLAANHVVRDVNEFLLWLKLSGRERQLKAGTYEFYKYKNPLHIIDKLSSGGKSEIIVTIPEGCNIYETAEILAKNGLVDKNRFIELCSDANFIMGLGLDALSLEGYFFPDTYSFSNTQNEEEIIKVFIKNFTRIITKFSLEKHDTLHKILILASLVEKEAKYEDERPIIARVFINRLKTNRPLESCATVLYALKTNHGMMYKKILTEKDLKVASPYNTYLHLGLPPGPICSAGESSISAVLNPADVDYLYFISMGDGRHHFSRTYKEHIAAKRRYNENN